MECRACLAKTNRRKRKEKRPVINDVEDLSQCATKNRKRKKKKSFFELNTQEVSKIDR
jgi:hypothetical protein